MANREKSYREVVELAEHYVAIGMTDYYLGFGTTEFPWEFVGEVKAGCLHRLNMPASIEYRAPHPCGITFRWSVDMEPHNANGRGVSMFDAPLLRDVMRKLPAPARTAMAEFLADEILPGIEKSSAQIRAALNESEDSADCVRGLIAFAKQQPAA